MARTNKIFQVARFFGDTSSISKGAVGERIRHRALGKVGGRAMTGMGIWGLFMWAEFLQWLTNAVRRAAAKEMFIGTVVTYASLYEFGLFGDMPKRAKLPEGKRPGERVTGGSTKGYRHAPFFEPGIRAALKKRQSGKPFLEIPTGGRSGLYIGGRFAADLRSVVRGNIGGRLARRTAGASSSRFFWGALANPDHNVMEALARQVKTEIRRKIKQQDLIDTHALLDSISIGESVQEVKRKSAEKAIRRLVDHGLEDSIPHKISDEFAQTYIIGE